MGLYPASMVAPFALLVPIFGLAFAALLLGERVGAREVVAAVLVLGGVLLTLQAPRPTAREAISPQLAGIS
jgi:O-acetylserine/cysteine efflux transporter